MGTLSKGAWHEGKVLCIPADCFWCRQVAEGVFRSLRGPRERGSYLRAAGVLGLVKEGV